MIFWENIEESCNFQKIYDVGKVNLQTNAIYFIIYLQLPIVFMPLHLMVLILERNELFSIKKTTFVFVLSSDGWIRVYGLLVALYSKPYIL
jgi:hypothetical protein